MTPTERNQAVAAIAEKYEIHLDAKDPAFMLVELNQMMLGSEALKVSEQVTGAAEKLRETTVRNIDDFVSVANQALALFKARTSEIRQATDRLEKLVIPTTSTTSSSVLSTGSVESESYSTTDRWVLNHLPAVAGLVFALGAVMGGVVAHMWAS